MEEAGDLFACFCNGGSSCCGAKFHDGHVAIQPKFEGGWAVFVFSEDGFGDDVPVGCKHRRSSSILDGDLFHEAGVFDGKTLFFRTAVVVGVSVVPLCSHSVPEEQY